MSTVSPADKHPGPHIRDAILPKGMSVTEAARVLGVGRPALSNLLNAKAALSPEMAARLERAFGANAQELIDMQAIFDADPNGIKAISPTTIAYVPPFLHLKAIQIESWADCISARSRLSVLLRTLIHSTGLHITAADFPGNDDSQRPGWDGFVETDAATPWVPSGKSGWEFGVNQRVKEKADHDYAKSVRQESADERSKITFVFVTPRRWQGKEAWRATRRAERQWKDVRVYDASDLEQWMEQSIPAQAWFANERGLPSEGVLSLSACWREWTADCNPPLDEALFGEALAKTGQAVIEKLNKPSPEPVVVTADSLIEALAFLHCLFASDRSELAHLRDRMVVFREPGSLTKVASNSANFIPVITNREVEKEFAPFKATLEAILVYPRNAANVDADVTLEPLSYPAFETALTYMGYGREDVRRLSRESGCSLTVLRRRLSTLPAIQSPEWASDIRCGEWLVPFLFAGAWNSNNKADQVVLELLAGNTPYSTLEEQLAELLQLEDSPLWSIGTLRGLISKIDVLFAIQWRLTTAEIERFYDAAQLILSEDDPALDLPEDERWMAGFDGKTREISSALRDGIGETLVLLAIHGHALFKERLGFDPEQKTQVLIRALLSPLTARKLEAHSGDLPMYAEASPETFLDILEADLRTPEPEALKLMRPASSGVFGHCPRTGLLWALENIAWAPKHLTRAVDILARLSAPVIKDNWANKPNGSLAAIFRCWMPQTAANLEQRKAALTYLVNNYPTVAWPLCVQQFEADPGFGHYSHKPRWRPDGRGYGERVTNSEARSFRRHALDLALNWTAHTHDTLGDLVRNLQGVDDADQQKIWELVERWNETASDEDRAWLREIVRVYVRMNKDSSKLDIDGPSAQSIRRVKNVFQMLEPNDCIFKHAWLFKKNWLDESADERANKRDDFRTRGERVTKLRAAAVKAVFAVRGIDGIIALTEMGDAAWVVGRLLPEVLTNWNEQVDTIRLLLANGSLAESLARQSLISGLLHSLCDEDLTLLLSELACQRELAETVSLIVLAPFRRTTWDLVQSLGDDVEKAYWEQVKPDWGKHDDSDLNFAVDRFLAFDRPRAAFSFAHMDLNLVPPKQLFRLMRAAATSSSEETGTYQLRQYYIAEAFRLLNKSGEVSVNEMAGLEFAYIEAFDRDEDSIPNLERIIEENAELFVELIVYMYRRNDSSEDPEPLRATNPQLAEQRAKRAYAVLTKLSRIPGHHRHGEIEPECLLKWINIVRTSCEKLARSDVCDLTIGKLFAKAPVGKDGVWPCEPMRAVIEQVATEELSRGITNGLYNARGMIQKRGEGGEQERELAEKYEVWARALDFTYPRTAQIVREMGQTYEREARREDNAAGIRRRLRD